VHRPSLLAAWFLALAPATCLAAGEELIDAIMRSDFVFDRGLTNAPFPPLGYLTLSDFGTAQYAGDCATADDCRFDTRQAAVGAGLPFWVRQKDMLVAGAALSVNGLEQDARERTVYSAGLLGAGIQQPTTELQWGAFVFPQWHSGVRGGSADTGQLITGAVARYRHSARFHTYYGLVYLGGEPDDLWLPYFGLDWFPNNEWVVSLVAPWPAVVWAPSPDWHLRLGAVPSGASWQFSQDGSKRTADLSRWQFGLSYERRVRRQIWAGLGAGVSGFGRLSIRDGDLETDFDIDDGAYVELFLRFRPGGY